MHWVKSACVPDESIRICGSMKDLVLVGVLVLIEFVKIVVAVFDCWAYIVRL